MRFSRLVTLSAFVLGVTSHTLEFPQVKAIVDDAMDQVQEYVHFNGNETEIIEKRQSSSYWYENIPHRGISAFGPQGYTVYRNVKDFGARGDGVTDDTAAINAAISSGGRCGRGCTTSTTTPATIYFPSGTYLISSSIVDYYYTNLIGNPINRPVLKAAPNFAGFGLIDGNPYYTQDQNWLSTTVFWRQVRNFVLDMTAIPPEAPATGIHWPTAQATSIQFVEFRMSTASGVKAVGLFIENGSAGMIMDVTFNGGMIGLQTGNQQFTMRNLVFNNCVKAIEQIWDWGWTYQGISINNCQIGFDISAGGTSASTVGSVVFFDSSITNTPVGIVSAYASNIQPVSHNSLILENVRLTNVPTAIRYLDGSTILAGTTGSTTIAAWGQGQRYTPTGPQRFQGSLTPNSRPASLLSGDRYYTRAKPQYESLTAASFSSVRAAGATGNGVTDDTAAIQSIINSATAAGRVVYFDCGTYKVTSTILIPPGARLVGESYPIIMSSGSFFNDMNNPRPVIQVGTAGSTGQVEWSDMVVSTQGAQAGAILIQWNLATSGTPSGMWDVHTRIGGFAGSQLQLAQCPTTPGNPAINRNCIGAYISMHVTPTGSNLYLENVWLWTADHDLEDASNSQVTIYNGRGIYIESTSGPFWLIGTSSEHHVLYQYQFANTRNIFAGYIQTETPYYQPNPPAPAPFTVVPALRDPDFATSCIGQSGYCAEAWGLRIINSQNILIYGMGLYSFFIDYNNACAQPESPDCQANIFSIEGSVSNIKVYAHNTVGTTNMITVNGVTIARRINHLGAFQDSIALFQAADGGSSVTSGSTIRTSSTTSRMSSFGSSSVTTRTSSLTTRISLTSIRSSSITTTRVSTTTARTTSPTATPTSGTTGWVYQGCYTDTDDAHILAVLQDIPGGSGATSVDGCNNNCRQGNYVYSGLRNGNQCWCGNAILNGGAAGSTGCNVPCAGQPSRICGGSTSLSLYHWVS